MQPAYERDPRFAAAAAAPAQAAATVMTGVYWWMCLGLGITGVIAFGVSRVEALQQLIFGSSVVFFGLIITELLFVVALSAALHRLPIVVAAGMFVVYAGLNGLTLSVVFLMYTQASIASTFFVTGGTFGAMAAFGTFTKRDLSGWGSFLFMGLIGVVIGSVVNLFLASSMLYWLITFAGVLVFTGLTAYDVQRIRAMAQSGRFASGKLPIYGALRLYLDFINLFLMLLRLLGRRR